MSKVFIGIDPGQTGGLAVLDSLGRYLAAWRWDKKPPLVLYNKLFMYRELVNTVYLEHVRVFPREESGFISQNQSLLVNSGIWQGWLIALSIPYLEVDPVTWQTSAGLFQWAKKRQEDPARHSPLTLARHLWPSAPLDYQADDGKAVALHLAALAHRDHHQSIDRAQLQAQALTIRKAKATKKRHARKALKAQQSILTPSKGTVR